MARSRGKCPRRRGRIAPHPDALALVRRVAAQLPRTIRMTCVRWPGRARTRHAKRSERMRLTSSGTTSAPLGVGLEER